MSFSERAIALSGQSAAKARLSAAAQNLDFGDVSGENLALAPVLVVFRRRLGQRGIRLTDYDEKKKLLRVWRKSDTAPTKPKNVADSRL